MSIEPIEDFLRRAGWADANRRPLLSDASARRYHRLQRGAETAILMVAPVDTAEGRDSFAAFLRVGAYLRGQGICAPEVYAKDALLGLMLLEDFGDLRVSGLLGSDAGRDAYETAIDLACDLGASPVPPWVKQPSVTDQIGMVDLTFDQLPGQMDLADSLRSGLRKALETYTPGPLVLSLRDYHGDNLIWRPTQIGLARLGVLDFQDAVALPMGYDIASLIDDPRRVLPDALRVHLVARAAERAKIALPDMQARIDTLSLLRNLRILGIFHRLSQNGKPSYRAFLPRTMDLVRQVAANPGLAEMRQDVEATLRAVAPWTAGGNR